MNENVPLTQLFLLISHEEGFANKRVGNKSFPSPALLRGHSVACESPQIKATQIKLFLITASHLKFRE